MNRYKTAEQVRNQAIGLISRISLKHWNGKEYVKHSDMMRRIEFIHNASNRYVDNIYRIAGYDQNQINAHTSNFIYSNFEARTLDYMNYENK